MCQFDTDMRQVGCMFIGVLPPGVGLDDERVMERHHMLSVLIDNFVIQHVEVEKIKQINGVYFIVSGLTPTYDRQGEHNIHFYS